MLYQLVLVFHTVIALAIIGLVFLQHGKGADIGAAFGSGASNTVFGSQGSGGVLYKATGFLAFLFCVTSISLTVILAKERKAELQVSIPAVPTEVSVPAAGGTDVPVVNQESQGINETTGEGN
jgi:preprotein translocase subunit SecG